MIGGLPSPLPGGSQTAPKGLVAQGPPYQRGPENVAKVLATPPSRGPKVWLV
jgi:hypothetical protein